MVAADLLIYTVVVTDEGGPLRITMTSTSECARPA